MTARGIVRYLRVEAPDTQATVDFLSHHASVLISIDGDELVVKVRVSDGPDASSWDASELRAKLHTGGA